jgi:hypothetical protein
MLEKTNEKGALQIVDRDMGRYINVKLNGSNFQATPTNHPHPPSNN